MFSSGYIMFLLGIVRRALESSFSACGGAGGSPSC